MKLNPIISKCPVCEGELMATKLSCSHCDTHIESHFSLSKFNYLEKDKLYFIEVFMKNRGNIKAIEKEMNISYPTVKKLLDEVIIALGYTLEESSELEEKKDTTSSTLKALESGSISVKEAIEQIKKAKGEK